MVLGVRSDEESYQSLFEKVDDFGMDMIIESLFLPETTWLESVKSAEKIVLHMDLKSIPNV